MLLLIDNFDSFTFNLVQGLEMLGVEVVVFRNNTVSVQECLKLNPSYIVVGPGPGNPKQAGISNELIKTCQKLVPILGVCLGHQCIAEVYGGSVIRACSGPMHGKTSRIQHNNEGVFKGLPYGFEAARYHSLVVDIHSVPDCIAVTATSNDGEIMGLRHKEHAIEGVQFHPESILTKAGMQLLNNFLKLRTKKEILC
jgi:anthranilate synthase/aminodeoxychorismate synthase-like glutamine amidotransferase